MSAIREFVVKASTGICVTFCLCTPTVFANEYKEKVLSCANIENATKRLQCFDDFASQLKVNFYQQGNETNSIEKKLSSVEPEVVSPPIITVEEQESTINAEKQKAKHLEKEIAAFGLPKISIQDTVLADGELTSTVESTYQTNKRRLRVILSNGQVWEITDTRKAGLPEKGNEVVIKSGALGSFFIRKAETKRSFKVKRVSR